jgi:hypothetical protein
MPNNPPRVERPIRNEAAKTVATPPVRHNPTPPPAVAGPAAPVHRNPVDTRVNRRPADVAGNPALPAAKTITKTADALTPDSKKATNPKWADRAANARKEGAIAGPNPPIKNNTTEQKDTPIRRNPVPTNAPLGNNSPPNLEKRSSGIISQQDQRDARTTMADTRKRLDDAKKAKTDAPPAAKTNNPPPKVDNPPKIKTEGTPPKTDNNSKNGSGVPSTTKKEIPPPNKTIGPLPKNDSSSKNNATGPLTPKTDNPPLIKNGDVKDRKWGDGKIERPNDRKGDKPLDIIGPPKTDLPKKDIDKKNPLEPKGITREADKHPDSKLTPKDALPGTLPKLPKTKVDPKDNKGGPSDRHVPDHKNDGPKNLTPDKLPQGPNGPHIPDLPPNHPRRDNPPKPFDVRVKSGELDRVAKGDVAKQLNMAEQFKRMHDGDVARRMDLQRHLEHVQHQNETLKYLNGVHPHHGFYYGKIHPHYVDHAFRFHYYGYSFFAGECWYPRWNPWVSWSWGYHVHPIWDPRPLWCRPVIYQPYVVWNYWAPPVWQPLPEAAVGTWVDVKPVVVEPEQYDLQLLAVRMVDPGHPDEKLGPRYRVWFRNNSRLPITEPFAVMLFASNEKQFAKDLPRGGIRVTSIEAGDTQSVDIRLPIEVNTMNRDAAGQPAPFNFLHFFLDANREVNDANRENNGAVVPRDEMLPVDPASFEVDPVQVRVGGEMIIAGEGYGPQPGRVLLNIDGKELEAEISGWYDLGAKIILPKFEVNAPTEADLIVVRGDGAAANPVKVTLLPGEEEGPALVLPAEKE